MLAAAAAILARDFYFSAKHKQLLPVDGLGPAPQAPSIHWRNAIGLALLAWLPILLSFGIVVVPSGMAGVRVSQTSGTLPGTLPGTSLDPTGLPAPVPPPLPGAYEDTNQIGQIEIPALRISEHFYEGVALQTLNNGPGHWPGSAMPGQTGNTVVAGHRVSHTHPFRDLDQLKPGDEVVFTTSQGRNVYVVDRTQIVTPDALWIVKQTRDKTATLFACHPKGSTTHRIVVFLKYAPELSQPTA